MLKRRIFKDAAKELFSGRERCCVCAVRSVLPSYTDFSKEYKHLRDGIGYHHTAAEVVTHDLWIAEGLQANLMALAFAAVVKPEDFRKRR